MNPYRIIACAFTALVLPATASLQAALLVYEPYDYPAESLVPGNDSTYLDQNDIPVAEGGTGLQQAKLIQQRQPLTITDKGLTYTDQAGKQLKVKGQAALLPEGNSGAFAIETGAAAFEKFLIPDRPGVIGHPGTEIWFSFLMEATGTPDATKNFLIKFSGGQSGFSIGMMNNKEEPRIRLISVASKEVVEDGRVYLIVGHIVYGEENSMGVWINPDIGNEQPTDEPNIKMPNFAPQFRDFWYTTDTKGGLKVRFDEIRIGESFQEVAPVN